MIKRAMVFAAVMMLGFVALADDKEEFKAKCPVSGQPAKKAAAVKYGGGEVYFCCENCSAKFEKDSSKFAAKANHQLVATGQAKQEKCPFSGGKLNPETKIEIEGVAVCFCCNNCKGKAEKSDDVIALVFGDAFKKGFKVEKKEEKK